MPRSTKEDWVPTAKGEMVHIIYATTKLSVSEESRKRLVESFKNKPYKLEKASDELKNDREIVLAAVSNGGFTLEYASDELKNDREIVLAAISNMGTAIAYASDELRNDREIVLTAVGNCGSAIEYASKRLRNDREIVLAAVTENGKALEFTSDEFKNDREIVLAAVVDDYSGYALQHASEELRNDHEIVLASKKNTNISKQILAETELKTLKEYFDWQSAAQDDVWSSELWDVEDEELDDEASQESVIIWSMARYSEGDDDEENKYEICVELRQYDEDGEVYGEDEYIDSFTVSLGSSKEDLEILNDAINSFLESGGTREDIEDRLSFLSEGSIMRSWVKNSLEQNNEN